MRKRQALPASSSNTNLRTLLITFVVMLLIFGLVMLYSTTSSVNGMKTLINQGMYMVIGLTAAAVIRKLDYRIIGRYGFVFLVLIMFPLLYLAVARFLLETGKVDSMPFTKMIKNACRWIKLPGGFSIQPSEFAKLAIILYLANYYEKNQRYILKFWRPIFIPFFWTGLVTFLIFAGKNLSITVVCGCLIIAMSFFAGIRLRWFISVIVLGVTVLAVDYFAFEPENRIILEKYRVERMTSFMDPEMVKDDSGFQLWRSQLALGSGGLAGQGFNNSIMKNEYIPEAHTDFILSIIGEELGFITLVLILGISLGVVLVGYAISATAKDYMGAYIAAGISTSILFHTLLNFSVMCGLFPTTGVTMPFISYGGSSILANLIGIGFLLSVERASGKKEKANR